MNPAKNGGITQVWKNGSKIVDFKGKPTMFYDGGKVDRRPYIWPLDFPCRNFSKLHLQ